MQLGLEQEGAQQVEAKTQQVANEKVRLTQAKANRLEREKQSESKKV